MIKFKNFDLLLPICLGIAAFILVTGGKIVWPGNIDWLYLHGDSEDGLFAWQFFRHTPLLQNPLGANFPYGMGVGGSIIYAEPLFLFAFAFKIISKILPTPFQYMGLWVLLCFILQSIFSWKLIETITQDIGFKIFGSIFFTLAPPFLWRLHGHPQFLGQWLILVAILLNLSKCFHSYVWPLVLILSSLVHPYLLLILLALWVADLIQRKIAHELTNADIIKKIIFTWILLLLFMWQAGYFMLHGSFEAGGLGFYRMNILSFIDPSDDAFNSWSYILSKQAHTEGDFEGFSFLGLGMLFLFMLGIFKLIEVGKLKILFFNFKRISPLVSIAFLLMIFALSNRIVFGKYELFQYKLPAFANIFRATGRMVLPMYYLIYLGIFYLIIKVYNKAFTKILIFICLLIQIIDSSGIYNQFRNWLSHAPRYVSPLKSPVWIDAAKQYTKLIYVLPEERPVDWVSLVNYSAFNGLNINIGYFARTNIDLLNRNRSKLVDLIVHGQLEKDTFYVIKDAGLQRIILHTKMNIPSKITRADGFLLLLPNWKPVKQLEAINSDNYKLYIPGTTILFKNCKQNFNDYLVLINGWSVPEKEGIWTNGDHSTLVLKLSRVTNSNLLLKIDAIPFINKEHPILKTDILVNEKILGHIAYDFHNIPKPIQLEIPKAIISSNKIIKIEFLFKKAVSPKQLCISEDTRKLGLFIYSLKLVSN